MKQFGGNSLNPESSGSFEMVNYVFEFLSKQAIVLKCLHSAIVIIRKLATFISYLWIFFCF